MSNWKAKTYAEVAKFFQVKPETISLWVKQGCPIIRRGQYDLSEMAVWREKQLREEAGLLSGDDTPALEQYRQARADLAKIELAEKEKSVLQAEEVIIAWREAALEIQAAIKRLESKNQEAAKALRDEIIKIQKRLKEKWTTEITE